ncbi:hypothetical protein [Streptosporangium subroseum]|uniref:hypothetical protein n=1 Tax=Streptosporangium subroseum TaxID=106412 RepID=UPI00308726FC|nr:hypothetical protein OHB15_22790 [Streptosporangium subroseum]
MTMINTNNNPKQRQSTQSRLAFRVDAIDALPYALVWRAENELVRALARVAADIGTLVF